jgi:hypothetical protein
MQDCPALQRVTTEYAPVQDRIRLAGATTEDETVVLWLTQRLLNRLAPRLTRWLEENGGADTTVGVVDNEMLQGFAQQSAQASLEPQLPVQAHAPAASWRVDSVDIVTGTGAVSLKFRSSDVESASLTLTTQALRQWLGIVHDQYVKGEWVTTIWPAWMTEARQSNPKPSTVALH